MADRVQETFVFQTTPEKLLGILRDMESYPDWQPEIKEAEVLERDEEGLPRTVRFLFKGAMFTATYTLAYTHRDDGMDFELVEGDIIKSLEGRWDLEPEGDGATKALYELDAEPAIKIPKMLRRQGAKRMIENTATGLRQLTELE